MISQNRNTKENQGGNSDKRLHYFLSSCGVLGCIALLVYFSAPYIIFPFPSANASSLQIVASAKTYAVDYLLAAWLQGSGTLLILVFVLGLVHSAKAWNSFAGWMTMLAAAAVLVLSLNEGSYFVDVAQAVTNGHTEAATTSFDLIFTFIRTFFIAPSLLLPLSFVLRSSTILPKTFWLWSLSLGIGFEVYGFVGIFATAILFPAIILLILMMAWVIVASTYFLRVRGL